MQLTLSKQTQLPIFVLEIQKIKTDKTFIELRYTKLWFFLLFCMSVKHYLLHWGRNIGWGCSRIECWGRYVGLRVAK